MLQLTNLVNKVKGVPPIAWQIAGCLLLIGIGFYGGIKFSDAKLHRQEAKYEDQIKKLDTDIALKNADLQTHLQIEAQKTQAALDAQAQANQAKISADDAEKRYRALEAKLHITPVPNNGSDTLPPLPNIPPSADDIATLCDEVIAKKDDQIKGLTIGLTDCFDAKAAADAALKDAQSIITDHETKESFQDKLNNDLSKELESQKRRKWLYFGGGIILVGLAGHAIAK